MTRRIRWAWLAIATAAACASAPVAESTRPIDWAAVSDEKVPTLLTRNENGSERVTKLWLVVIDGQGWIRTSNTRWFRNIRRDPHVVLRIGGGAYPLRAELVEDDALRELANAAFREKYGLQDRLIHPFGGSGMNIMRLVPREAKS